MLRMTKTTWGMLTWLMMIMPMVLGSLEMARLDR